MKLNEPQMNSVLQQIAKQNQWFSEITKIAQSFQVPDAYLKALSYYQSPAYAQMIEQTNALAKMVAPSAWTLPQSQLASALKTFENQQKQLRDMVESPLAKMAKAINESTSLYNADMQSFWKTSLDLFSQFDLEDRNHLADLASQEVPVLEMQSEADLPEITEEEIASWKKQLPFLQNLSMEQVKNVLVRIVMIISFLLNVKGCINDEISHQDAVQAYQDSVQAHQDFLESQKANHAIQTNSPATSNEKK